ncbi:MAG: tyrosine-type recombinase/integrase [Deltaproteobacteria bacterium]|jgi:site-specific recombinase XerD|nr:tyrosine-type recombinase/integrase [Deltaproteobacteria bacterium]
MLDSISIVEYDFKTLREKLITQLREHDYKERCIGFYDNELTILNKFMDINQIENYSDKIGILYREFRAKQLNKNSRKNLFIRTVINRLNDVLINSDYIISHQLFSTPSCPHEFSEISDLFFEYLDKRKLKENTIKLYKNYLFEFFHILVSSGLTNISEMQPQHIYNAFLTCKSQQCLKDAISPFLKFIASSKFHECDLSIFIPQIKRKLDLPSTLSDDEIVKIFSTIDISTIMGKRDHLILLLATKLGFRASDIRNLRLSNLDFSAKKISIIQYKTGIPLQTIMLPDIYNALILYLKEVKPTSNDDHIFKSQRAPHYALKCGAISNIARKYTLLSGIDIKSRKIGSHSLRRSLATKLLSQNTPYPIIQKILGHKTPNSTKHYVRIDINQLRSCALDVPPPSGQFAIRLKFK